MNFDWTAEQRALADSVTRFVEREYDWDTRMRAIRTDEGRDPAHWATFAELGWLGAGLGEDRGGFGGGAAENAVIAQELGRALVNEPFAAHVAAINLLAATESDTVRAIIEPVIMGEERVAAALHEPQARGDFRQITARYEPDGKGWRLHGAKSLVENATGAEHMLVPARGELGLAVFLVATGASGVGRRIYRLLDSRHVCDFTFADVAVGPEALVVMGSHADEALALAIDQALVVQSAEAVGTMDAAIHATRDYLQTRKQFKAPLASFQALQHRMADMLIELEMTRSLLFHAIGAMSGPAGRRAAATSALKAQAASAGLHVTREAIQMHGGIGLTEELAISHYYRRLYVSARLLGDEAVHLDRFAHATNG